MAAFQELLNPVHSPEKKKVLEAIAGRGPRIIPVEIASATGMSLPLVVTELNNIASETNAHLEVTESGNIAYKFPSNLDQAYTANASRQMWRSAMRVVANVSMIVMRAFIAAMFFIVRISFGLALILGAILIVVLIVAVVIAGLKSISGDSDSGGGGDFNFDFGSIFDFGFNNGYSYRPSYLYWMFDWFWDWIFYWRYVIPTPGYDSNAPYDPQGDYRNKDKKEKSNFLFNVFSYLFGDGDPNVGFEERKWQTIAQVIAMNQGVVTAEQIAPYTGLDPKNEDWMISVMQRFTGSPEVTEAGSIIYVFPSFQSAKAQAFQGQGQNQSGYSPATNAVANENDFAPDNLSQLFNQHIGRQQAIRTGQHRALSREGFLAEKEWPFMTVKGGGLWSIIAFGLFVLFGSIFLVFSIPYVALLQALQPLVYMLFGYGLLFFLIPALRFPVYRMINDGIIERNERKMAYAASLAKPEASLATKLADARTIRINGLPRSVDKTVYTTEKDALDQSDELSEQFENMEAGAEAAGATETTRDAADSGAGSDFKRLGGAKRDDVIDHKIDLRREKPEYEQ
jgi:hypothetical protein